VLPGGTEGKVIALTYVPLFKKACLHIGKISNNDWLPFFFKGGE